MVGMRLISAALALLVFSAHADIFNNKIILVGDKGAALGGAFTGLADDATATYYNPAGMTQIKNVKLNVSAQVVQYQMQSIQIAPSTFIPYNSFNFSPSITSFSQRLGRWAYGFSIVTPVNDLFRGEQSFESAYRDTDTTGRCYDPEWTPCYTKLNLGYYEVTKMNLVGPSLALKVSDRISLGATLYGIYYTNLEKTSFGGWDANFVNRDPKDMSRFHEDEVLRTVNQTGFGMVGTVGILISLPNGISLGVNASPGGTVWVDRSEEQRYIDFNNDSLVQGPDDFSDTRAKWIYTLGGEESHKEISAPRLSIGVAMTPWDRLMLTGQIDYLLGSLYSYTGFTPIGNPDSRSDFETLEAAEIQYTVGKRPVINLSGGLNLRMTKAYSLAMGGYTDFSQGPYEDRPAGWNRRIDYYGATLSLGMDKQYTESRFGLGASWGDAAISHFQWRQNAGGKPAIATNKDGSIRRLRKRFDAFNFGLFLSSTLKI